jgi:hypothetical protein
VSLHLEEYLTPNAVVFPRFQRFQAQKTPQKRR